MDFNDKAARLYSGIHDKKAMEEVEKKKNLPALSRIKFQRLCEGLSAQIMHIGRYSEEGSTIEKLQNFIVEKSYEFGSSLPGKRHHEIYLSNMRRTKPQKLKTIIRQSVKARS